MLFKVFDRKDQNGHHQPIGDLRKDGAHAIRRITGLKNEFLKDCEKRPQTEGLDLDSRRDWGDCMGYAAVLLATRNIMPGPSASGFLTSMADPDMRSGVAGSLASRMSGGARTTDMARSTKRDIESYLKMYEGFVVADFRQGRAQPAIFMEAYQQDHHRLRDMVAEVRKIFVHAEDLLSYGGELEKNDDIVEIKNQVIGQACGGCSLDEIEAFQEDMHRSWREASEGEEWAPTEPEPA